MRFLRFTGIASIASGIVVLLQGCTPGEWLIALLLLFSVQGGEPTPGIICTPTPTTNIALPETITINPNTEALGNIFYNFDASLEVGKWYRLIADSQVLYSASELTPSQLHLTIDNGTYRRHTYLGNGSSSIRREIMVNAMGSTLGVKLTDAPGGYTDNSGTIDITLEEYDGCNPPNNPSEPSGTLLETLVIDGGDNTTNFFSESLAVGEWYKLVIESSVLYMASETTPSQLHLFIDNADGNPATEDYGRFSFVGNGSAIMRQEILINARNASLGVKLDDNTYGDNSGSVTIKLEKLP